MRKLVCMFMALLFSSMQLLAQTRTISGKITDAKDGSGIPAASIVVKGTNVGTQTKNDGTFSLAVPPNAKSIVISAIGFQETEISITGTETFDIQMQADDKRLSEVVVTALGIEKSRKNLGYSASTLKNDELTTARTTNIANALTAKVAGVRVSGSNGMVGSSSAIFIRGFNTISGSNQPLFVVDGIPIDNSGGGNALQNGVANSNRAIDLNQDDIESISVLKGPAAAVLYGSRAASGAILITTKKGKQRAKNNIQFTSTTQMVNVNRYPDYQNEYAQGGVQGGAFNPLSNFSWGPQITGQTVNNFRGQPETLTAYPNNVRDFFETGINAQNNLSFTGGGNNTSFRLSYGNLYETGVIKNNKLNRHNFAFNGSAKVHEKLTVGLSANYVNSTSKRTQQGNQLANPLFRLWFLPRNINLRNYPYINPDGSQIYFDGTDNPLWTVERNLYDDYVSRFFGNLNFKYDVNSWFNITYKIGGDFYNQYERGFDEIGSVGGGSTSAGGVGGILDRNSNFFSYYSYLNFNFKKTIARDWDLSLVLGNESAWRGSYSSQIIGRQLSVRGFRNLSNAAVFNPSNFESRSFLTGAYADFNISYKGIASLNLTGRNDWSSTFPLSKRSYFYPAVAGTINLTEAIPSLKNNDLINFAKVYANYARVGKEAAPYSTNTFFGTAGAADGFGPTISFPYAGLPGFTLGNSAGDPNLGPEFTSSWEVGTEISLLKNRLGLEVTYFKSNSTDIIFSVPVSPSSGFGSFTTNAGELESKGWEVLFRATPIKTKKGSWDLTLNFTRNRTITKRLADGVPNIILAGFTTPNARLEVGKPYGVLYGSVFRRNSKGELWLNAAGLPVLAPDNVQIGDPTPDWLLGVTNDINIGNFTLTFLLDIRKGGDIFSRNLGDLYRSGAAAETAEFPRFNADGTVNTPYVIPGVGPDGVSPNTVRLSAQQYYSNVWLFGSGERYVFDGSWFRLRELSMSYKIPASALKNSFFGGLEIGVLGRNLFLHAPNYPHLDPENNVLGASNAQGLEFNGAPSTRNLGIFLRANF